MKALTGIKANIINRIKENGLHTIELITPDNVSTSQELDKGEAVLITNEGKKDLTKGTQGVVGEVKTKEVFYQKTDTLYDEEETLSVRLQLEFRDEVKTTNVLVKELGTEVEIERHLFVG